MGTFEKIFELEYKSLLKLSEWNEISINAKSVERQRVSSCLRVFSDKTYSALLTHPLLNVDEVKDTVAFLKLVI